MYVRQEKQVCRNHILFRVNFNGEGVVALPNSFMQFIIQLINEKKIVRVGVVQGQHEICVKINQTGQGGHK